MDPAMLPTIRRLAWAAMPTISEADAQASVRAAQQDVCRRIRDSGPAPDNPMLLTAAADSHRPSQFASRREALGLFIACELDTVTPGERGLGRLDAHRWPRLGGKFRSQLADDPSKLPFVRPILNLLAAGWVAGGALTPFRERAAASRYPLLDRDLNGTMEVWVPQMVYAVDPTHDLIMGLVEGAGSAPVHAFVSLAKERGLAAGIRRKAKEHVATRLALFYVGAGIALFDTQTTRWNDKDLLHRTIAGFGGAA